MADLNNEHEKFAFMEDGLLNRLSGEEQLLFNRLLKEDDAFASEVEYLKLTIQSARDYALKKQISEVLQPLYQKDERMDWIKKRVIVSSLALLLALGTASGFLYRSPGELYQLSVEQGMARQLQPHPCDDKEKAQSLYNDPVIEAYFRCDFATCVAVYQKVAAPSAEATFYAANSYLALQQYRQAQQCLQKSMDQNSPAKIQRLSRWYLALLALQLNNDAPAREQLQALEGDPLAQQGIKNGLLLHYLKNNRPEAAADILSSMEGQWKLKFQLALLTLKNKLLGA